MATGCKGHESKHVHVVLYCNVQKDVKKHVCLMQAIDTWDKNSMMRTNKQNK